MSDYTPSATPSPTYTDNELNNESNLQYMDSREGSESPPIGGVARTSTDQLKDLFKLVHQYTPQEIEIQPKLKPFIPDYIPAVGDIDAFIKIPRPDAKPDNLGLTVLDEPIAAQSDPSVLDLHLRAISKTPHVGPSQIRALSSAEIRSNPKHIDNWINSITELHANKPPPTVTYSRRMPDIETLMQEWSPELEAKISQINLPEASLNLSLPDFARLACAILDIPVYPSPAVVEGAPKPLSNHLIESLHVMFTLWLEFRNSEHFKGRMEMAKAGLEDT